MSAASAKPKLSLATRKSVRDDYEQHVEAVLQEAQKVSSITSLQFLPNIEDNYAKLSAYEKTLDRTQPDTDMYLSRSWEKTYGQAILSYFQGFLDKLKFQGFDRDDMLQEGLREAISESSVSLKIVEESLGSSCDCIIEEGTLVIRTTAQRWWASPDSACDQIQELL